MATTPPAGWYAEPSGGSGQRYWDGQAWTEHRRPAEPSGAAPSAPMPSGAAPVAASAAGVDARSGLPLADIGQRFLAYLIDVALGVGAFVAVVVVSLVATAISEGFGVLVAFVGYVGIIVGGLVLFILSEGGNLGQTPGKHLIGIKVVGPTTPIGYGRGAGRYFGRMLDSIVCGLPIGLVWALFDAERRTWHDLVADTRVVVAHTPEKSLGFWWANFRG